MCVPGRVGVWDGHAQTWRRRHTHLGKACDRAPRGSPPSAAATASRSCSRRVVSLRQTQANAHSTCHMRTRSGIRRRGGFPSLRKTLATQDVLFGGFPTKILAKPFRLPFGVPSEALGNPFGIISEFVRRSNGCLHNLFCMPTFSASLEFASHAFSHRTPSRQWGLQGHSHQILVEETRNDFMQLGHHHA